MMNEFSRFDSRHHLNPFLNAMTVGGCFCTGMNTPLNYCKLVALDWKANADPELARAGAKISSWNEYRAKTPLTLADGPVGDKVPVIPLRKWTEKTKSSRTARLHFPDQGSVTASLVDDSSRKCFEG